MDVTQLRIIHRLSAAWLVSLQDLSAGIAVPGFLTRGSSSTKLARHAFQDLGVPECTFRTIKHQSYKHRPKKIRKNNWVYVWERCLLIHLPCSDAKRRFQLKNLINIKYFLTDSLTSHLKNVHSSNSNSAIRYQSQAPKNSVICTGGLDVVCVNILTFTWTKWDESSKLPRTKIVQKSKYNKTKLRYL